MVDIDMAYGGVEEAALYRESIYALIRVTTAQGALAEPPTVM